MTNHCIRIGLENNCSTLKRLSLLSYHELDYDVLSSYKLNAISQACGRLSQMKQSIKRGRVTKSPFIRKPFMTNCYGIKRNNTLLSIPFKYHQSVNILLNSHTMQILSDKSLKIRSFSMTPTSISLCISKQVDEIKCTNVVGIDRNLRNVTVGNSQLVTFYKTNKLLSIKENTIHARAGFKRNDNRVKSIFWKNKNNRMQNRTKQFIHKISRQIVNNALETKSMIAFENLKGIRKMYRKGNDQGNKYRRKLNGWQFYEFLRQVEYKARWVGIPVISIDPKCTSKLCPVCGKRIQEDKLQSRKLWCNNCMKSMDRDVVASLNISYKGWTRFIHHQDDTGEAESDAFESAMSEHKLSNYDNLSIRIVDVSKSGSR